MSNLKSCIFQNSCKLFGHLFCPIDGSTYCAESLGKDKVVFSTFKMISKLENIFITWPFSPKVFYYSLPTLPTLTTYLPTSPTYLTSPHLPTLNNRKSLFCRCRSRRIWPTLEQARLPKKFGFCQRGELHNYIIFMIKQETIHAYMTTGLRYSPQF